MVADPSVSLIAVHKAKYFADKDEKLSLGPGGFVQGNYQRNLARFQAYISNF